MVSSRRSPGIPLRLQPFHARDEVWSSAVVCGTLCARNVGARLHFAILGPLEVRRDGVVVGIGGPRQRALLALLLCSANRVLSRDRLIDELLGDQPARSPDRMLRVQVSRLRKALADGDERPRLLSRPPGYVLRVEAGELDLVAFDQLVGDGRAALELDDPFRYSCEIW
jgi:DNA-binding SARP family transcriptional activator